MPAFFILRGAFISTNLSKIKLSILTLFSLIVFGPLLSFGQACFPEKGDNQVLSICNR